MKTKIISQGLSVCFGFLLCFSQFAKAQSPSVTDTKSQLMKNLQGVWRLNKIREGKTEVALNRYPKTTSQFEFLENASYTAQVGDHKSDSGLYRTNEDHLFIYFDSVNGRGTDEWIASVDETVLTLSRRGKKGRKILEFEYVKVVRSEDAEVKK